ncbi:MAG: fatty acid desaturase, partial [Actinomycetota bacterium]|nr:fatty acid desaturase [Actinomycetota bacterium]
MAQVASSRYALSAANTERARQAGYVDAQWPLPVIDPSRLREFQERSNARAALSTALWLALLLMSGWVLVATWWSWWSLPAVAVYSALYGGASDSRWHEMGHGTAFNSRRLNDAVYYLACFMLLRGPTVWRWSHYRHHTDTIITGHDAEIAFQRPPSIVRTLWRFTHVQGGLELLNRLLSHSVGRLDAEARELVPEHEQHRVVVESRVMVVILAAAVMMSGLLSSA